MQVRMTCNGWVTSWVGFEPSQEQIAKAVGEMYDALKYNNLTNFIITIERKEED